MAGSELFWVSFAFRFLVGFRAVSLSGLTKDGQSGIGVLTSSHDNAFHTQESPGLSSPRELVRAIRRDLKVGVTVAEAGRCSG